MENLFGHLKEEALRHIKIPSFEEAKQIIDEYIRFFNYKRLQLKTRQTHYHKVIVIVSLKLLSYSIYLFGVE